MHQGAAMKNGWPVKSLGEVLQKAETINPLLSPEAEFDYIDVSSVSNTTFEIEETQRLKGKDAPSRARRLVRANDVLFATVRPTLRRIAVVPEHLDKQICSTGYFVLRPRAGIDHRFIFYSLFTDEFLNQMESLQKGASYPAVTDGEVRAQLIPVPPPDEQHRIVGILDEAFDEIAAARANAEKNLQNARALFESYLRTVFAQRGEGWLEKRLTDVAKVFARGKSRHRPRNAPKLYGGRYPFVQTGDISNANHRLTSYSQTYSEVGLAQSKLWPRGTVCIAIVGATVGETAILDFDACIPDSVIGIVADEHFADYEFIEYLLQSFKSFLKEKGKGTARDNINLGTFENQSFPFPNLKMQKLIVSTLNELDEETHRLESIYQRKLDALEALKKSLLHRAFTGQL
jgi:type I restriction enzyme S subunit